MSVTSGFFNSVHGDRRYDARQLTALFNGIINDGIFANIGSAFAVRANGDTDVITVGIGRAWFNSIWVDNDAILPLTLAASEVLLDRYDAVVIEVDDSDAVRDGNIKVITGTPSSTPAYPTLINTHDVHQYPLAYVYRAAGTAIVTQSDIINMIGTGRTPYITGILQVQNIDNIVAQWQDEWARWYLGKDTEIDSWFANTKAEYEDWTDEQKDEYKEWSARQKSEFNIWFTSIRKSLEGDIAADLADKILKLEDGTTPAGDANKLGGRSAEEWNTSIDTILQLDGTKILNESVLETAKALPKGIYAYAIGADGYTGNDLPADYYRYSSAIIIKARPDDAVVFLIGRKDISEVLPTYNMLDFTTKQWTGWRTFATTADFANYLPLSGGKLTGGIDIVTGIPYIDFHYGSDETLDYTVRIYEDSKGVLGIRNGADPGKILKIDTTKLSGTTAILHTGNYSEYALPKAGGRMTDGSEIGFAPWNSASCAVGAAFYNYGSTARSGGYNALFNNGNINCLSMAVSSTPWDISTGLSITASAVKWKNKDVHHDGNSAKVVIQSSAPSDTSALWVW